MAEALWGGRFSDPVDPALDPFTRSFGFDGRLAWADLVGSLAHARMLSETEILSPEEGAAILEGLAGMLADLEGGTLRPEGEWEDVHTWIEGTLRARIGPAAGRLHTGRSRNDQTALALRIWMRVEFERIAGALAALMEAWLIQARAHVGTPMPGYTHLQRAQPVSLAHYLLAHFWFLEADADRVMRVHRLSGRSPLGAAALAGTSHPVDPARAAHLAGLPEIFRNSLHAVSDRDYVVEALQACALLQTHLSRWAEEVVLFASREFGFIGLQDRVAKGSSLMPQKKNPEAAELIRGRAGRTIGDLVSVLTVLKGLPLAYNSDLQEDKEPLFDAADTVRTSLEAALLLSGGITWRPAAMRAALEEGHVTATELADYLVGRGLPFREAHEAVGRMVRCAEDAGVPLRRLPLGTLRSVCPEVEEDVFAVLDPEAALARHTSPGGPAPERVTEQLQQAESALGGLRTWLASVEPPPVYSAYREGALVESSQEGRAGEPQAAGRSDPGHPRGRGDRDPAGPR